MEGLARQRPIPLGPLPGQAGRQRPVRDIVSRRVEGDLHRCGRSELTARAHRVASALAAAGLAPGDAVATLAWNGHRHVELALAACAIGIRLQPLDPHDHPDRIVEIAHETGVRNLFFDLSFMPLVEEIAPRLPSAQRVVALTDQAGMPGPATIPDLRCYEDLVDGTPRGADRPARDGEIIRAAARTAGLPDAQAFSPMAPSQAGNRPTLLPRDTVLAAIPIFHADGRELVAAAWAAGAGLILPGPWLDGRSLHGLLESEAVTVAAAPGQIWRGVLAQIEREGGSLAGLRLAIVTGDAASRRAAAGMLRDRYGVEVPRIPGGTPLYGWGDAREASALGSSATNNGSDAKEETQ